MTQHSLYPCGVSASFLRVTSRATRLLRLLALLCCAAFVANVAAAQTAGLGSIIGTVTDSAGAVVPNATVTVTALSTGVSTVRKSSGAGVYTVTPLTPDTYSVNVTASGFQSFEQKNVTVDGLATVGLNVTLRIGQVDQIVTVTEAPPALQTTNATIGAVIGQETYENLPLTMGGQQRDPTAFASLAPGAQSGARAPIFSGTGNYLAEVYVDGIPGTTANQQGDNRIVSNSLPVEAVQQLQVITSGPSAEYQGAGAINFTTKSGGSKYHGIIADYVRNTAFDSWSYMGKIATKLDPATGQQISAGKPVEHQNEFVASGGGPIPFTRNKGFFFATYDRYHGRTGVNPAYLTVPTTLMRAGNFTQVLSWHDPSKHQGGAEPIDPTNLAQDLTQLDNVIYDPTSNNCSGSTCTRRPLTSLVNGVPTLNVIPANYISPISQYEQKFLPAPSNSALFSNYLAGSGVSGYDNWEVTGKVDYQLTPSQRISFFMAHGVRGSVGYGATFDLPYTTGAVSVISPTIIIAEHSIVITPHLVNQFKYGFTRFPQPVTAPTDGVAPYRAAADIGITNLPPGQASSEFPGITFGTNSSFTNAPTTWTQAGASDATHITTPNAYTLVDNLQWSAGRHSVTAGFEVQWLQDNVSAQSGPSNIFTQTFATTSTASYAGGTNLNGTFNGNAYASFLLGAVNSAGTGIKSFDSTGGRFRPISPYFQDDWKLTPKLTLNLGLRYDYLPPYHEVQDRYSFFNPNIVNSLTGTPGQLQFAGNRGAGISCQCRTPVNTWWKNWGPRLGVAYSLNEKTVVRAGFAIAYSRAGGVGGRAGDSTGTGQNGFNANLILPAAVNAGVGAKPSFYLNNSSYFNSLGLGNTALGGPGFVLPTPIAPSGAALNNGIGNYANGSSYVTAGSAPGYADPYLSGRAPTFNFYNVAVQRALTNDLTVSLTYAGSQSHFVDGAGVPGFWSGQIDPQYLTTLGSVLASDGSTNILSAPATPANIAIAQRADPSVKIPYPAYVQTQATPNSVATIGRMLRPYPQYSSPPSLTWDNNANISYNSMQVVVNQREWHGMSFTFNYTYSKNIGDDGNIRSAFAVPAGASSTGVPIAGNNRADRDIVTTDTPHNLSVYGVDHLPFGRGHIGGENLLVRTLAGGWLLSGTFTYNSGAPIYVIASSCTAPSQGTCMPDLNPNFSGSANINGNYGRANTTAKTIGSVKYLDGNAFAQPGSFGLPAGAKAGAVPVTKIGGAPRFIGLRSPGRPNLNMALRRSFNVTPDRIKFIFGVDCTNVLNRVIFNSPATTGIATWAPNYATSSFGTINGASSDSRDFQFSGRLTF